MDASAAAFVVSAAAAPHTDASSGCSTAIYDKQLAWKLHGQRKLQHASDALRSREEEQCTFAPKTTRRSPQPQPTSLAASPRSDRSALSVDARSAGSPRSSACSPRPSTDGNGGSVHPTDAQESSILLHFARQERARGYASAAQQKLSSTLPAKDFSKTTKSAPFALSVGNWRPRQSTPTDERDGAARLSSSPSRSRAKSLPPDQQAASAAAQALDSLSTPPLPPAPATSRPRSKAKTVSNNHSRPDSTRSLTADDAWETERATLVAVLDAQRRELALRARAQADAVRAAESFAAATQRFEERLAALEARTADELHEIRRLLARQSAASDLILRSLGLALPPDPPSASGEDGKTVG